MVEATPAFQAVMKLLDDIEAQVASIGDNKDVAKQVLDVVDLYTRTIVSYGVDHPEVTVVMLRLGNIKSRLSPLLS